MLSLLRSHGAGRCWAKHTKTPLSTEQQREVQSFDEKIRYAIKDREIQNIIQH